MVKDLCGDDVALVELARNGKTDAPRDVLRGLRAKGYILLKGSSVTLTASGRDRGVRLKDAEADLRKLFAGSAAAPGRKITTAGTGHALRIGNGGAVRFQ
ncbi:hypothetical protein BH11PLA2_BH11PLA2_43930 [soil metagenome]